MPGFYIEIFQKVLMNIPQTSSHLNMSGHTT